MSRLLYQSRNENAPVGHLHGQRERRRTVRGPEPRHPDLPAEGRTTRWRECSPDPVIASIAAEGPLRRRARRLLPGIALILGVNRGSNLRRVRWPLGCKYAEITPRGGG